MWQSLKPEKHGISLKITKCLVYIPILKYFTKYFVVLINFYIYYTKNLLEFLLFLKNNSKNKKALQQKAKGLEMSGSPDRTIFELFV
jgi:hypothetical protein